MRITPAILEATYAFLVRTKPFSGWKLPHPEEVEFHVKRFHHTADAIDEGHKQVIRFNEHGASHTIRILEVMAHEMNHLHVGDFNGSATAHGPKFRRAWKQICRHHGFDPLDI